MTLAVAEPAAPFEVPDELIAHAPPEARGLGRDGVRLMLVAGTDIGHLGFAQLPTLLHAGDLLVVNLSATIPAAVPGRRAGGRDVVVHFATPLPDGEWIVELREPDGSGPQLDAAVDESVALARGAVIELVRPYDLRTPRFWRARPRLGDSVERWLQRHGRPISYGHASKRWPLQTYQTVFAREPGSAEMPSAARPFTDRLVTDLVSRGVQVAPICLHAGVSSADADEPLLPERFRVPESTARLVNATHRAGGRVIATGTTVVRALESAADDSGRVRSASGWTELRLTGERRARTVDGLITGWHEPGSSHLRLLESVAGSAPVARAYRAAIEHRYRWHEFGDSCLFITSPEARER